ncbi:hypothetical protein [Roseibium sp. RKSG952]|uniref:hypothetical protein n=1 Tax=Roseibium sp. RKSG952 TaxID=2529384 RepID=UPI0012BC1A3B|nr:hypothetical protein [Roseibium sp. RKSG952]MTH96611.1 hypothetical protein [Roseibium sp. RKSG952]
MATQALGKLMDDRLLRPTIPNEVKNMPSIALKPLSVAQNELLDEPGRRKKPGKWACSGLAGIMIAFAPLAVTASAQVVDCDAYAQNYANSYIGGGGQDLDVVDGAMQGAVAGGAWEGPSGARRGAIAGGALSVLDNLGATPEGWTALYDMAFRICRQETSRVNHHPRSLGDPSVSHRPGLNRVQRPMQQPPAALEPAPGSLEPDAPARFD